MARWSSRQDFLPVLQKSLLVCGTAFTASLGAQVMPDGECATPGNDGTAASLSGIVNTYYPGTANAGAAARCISVGTATGSSTPVAAGDLLLVIQMQHATIDANNDDGYGDNVNGAPGGLTNNRTAGVYEFVEARGAVGASGGFGCTAGQIPIQGRGTSAGLINSYSVANRATTTGRRTFQVIRVPQYINATLGGNLQARYWDGSTGGIVAIDTIGRTNLNGFSIGADGRGFRGGGGRALGGDGGASDTAYVSNVTLNAHGAKAEGIAGTTRYLYNQETGALVDTGTDEGYSAGGAARGAPGNAGGGGTDSNSGSNDENSGGGGGANAGSGGIGGNAWQSNIANGGFGGGAFVPGTPALNRIILGGGGGAGARNNSVDNQSSGGAGGGIIIVQTGEFRGTGSITAIGGQGPAPDNDGGGGGGSGGTIVLRDNDTLTTSDATNITLSVAGAAGSNAWATEAPGAFPGARHGPGGGGGGGRILLGPSLATGTATISGGAAGITTTANDTYGAGPGTVGVSVSFTGVPPGMRPGFECAPLPVTLAHVVVQDQGSVMRARWATASERNTVGFQWFADEAANQPLQDTLTPSERGNSVDPTAYESQIRRAPGGTYWLAEFDHRGHRTMFGPYRPGETFGRSPVDQVIDWSGIAEEFRGAASRGASNSQAAQLLVDRRGFQRVRFEHLLTSGIDLSGQPVDSLAILRGSRSVARRVVSEDAVFGSGDYIDFFAEHRLSIYGDKAAYQLVVSPGEALPLPSDTRAPGVSNPAWTWTEAEYAPQKSYNFASPTDDPWFADRLLAYSGAPAAKDIVLPVSAVAAVPRSASLTASLIGATNLSGTAPDHHVRMRVGGNWVQQATEDGLVEFGMEHSMSLGATDSQVDVGIEVTGSTPYPFDVVNLERVALRYPRLPVADESRWFGEGIQFGSVSNDPAAAPPEAASQALLSDGFEEPVAGNSVPSLRVRGLAGSQVFAYARSGGSWRHLADVRAESAASGWNVFVPTVLQGDDVFVATDEGFHQPTIAGLPALQDIQSGRAEYLVISHAQFIDAVQPLVQHRRSQGLSAAVVDVAQIYAQFGLGDPDPQAIQAYITFARAQRGTRYVLLVGGDTYDYHNYLGVGSISFVPAMYRSTSEVVRHAPVDAALADGDGDGVPDLAIGRLPVRTVAELNTMTAKLIAAESPRSTYQALLVSGASDPGISFSGMNDDFFAALPAGWSNSRIDVAALGASAARSALVSAWSQSPAMISYVGHSAPGQWTYDPLLTVGDVSQLAGTPAVPMVMQWGCWNTYFVSPSANSLAQALLLQGSHGAAGVFGAVSLTDISGHRHLAPATLSRFTSGQRIGDVILQARRDLAQRGIVLVEPMIGSNLLGDPAMVLP